MSDELMLSQADALINPEAAVQSIRKAYVRDQMDRASAAVAASGIAMTAFGLQRLIAAEDAAAFCKSLASEGDDSEEEENLVVEWCVHNSAAVVSTMQAMNALTDCRYEETEGLATQTAEHSAAGRTAWQRLVDKDPDLSDQSELTLWVGVLQRLPLLARIFDAQGKAQQHLFNGDRQRYLEDQGLILDLVADERRIPVAANDAYAPVFRQLLHQTEQTVRAQLNFVQRSLDAEHVGRFQPAGRKVFIVHGHDDAAWLSLGVMLKEEFGLESVVLKREASGTRPLIEKFEAEAKNCAFAIALITPDDKVTKGKAVTLQARPNVLFELGWFYGRLGPGRVTIIQKGRATALPSDLAGIVTLVYSANITEVLVELRQELRATGLIVPARTRRAPATRSATRTKRSSR